MLELLEENVKQYFFLKRDSIIVELISIIWILAVWEYYLNMRQYKLMKRTPKRPDFLKDIISEDVYDKSRTYAMDKNNFSTIQDLCSTVVHMMLIGLGGYYFLWQWSEKLLDVCGLDTTNEIYTSAVCTLLMSVLMTFFVGLPFTVYSTFVLEEKHGFNKQTVDFFIKDQLKKFVVTQVLIIPITCGIIWIVKNGGDYFFVYVWLFTVVVSLLLYILYPEFIMPLFDKFSPLPEGDLKSKIETLASSLNFPLYKILIVEGSKRSSHSNAYLAGILKYKRIVLFDTLVEEYNKKAENIKDDTEITKDETEITKNETEITKDEAESTKNETEITKEKAENTNEKKEGARAVKGCTTEEILGVLCHELGHWHYSHAVKFFICSQISFLVNFTPFFLLLNFKPLYSSFGFFDSQPVLIGLLVVTMYVLTPVNALISWALAIYSRKCEFEADQFAVIRGHSKALCQALIKLHKDNLGYPLFDKLYSGWHHSHPPLLERLEAISKQE